VLLRLLKLALKPWFLATSSCIKTAVFASLLMVSVFMKWSSSSVLAVQWMLVVRIRSSQQDKPYRSGTATRLTCSSHCWCFHSGSKLKLPAALCPACEEAGDCWYVANYCQTVKWRLTTPVVLVIWQCVALRAMARWRDQLRNRYLLQQWQATRIIILSMDGGGTAAVSCSHSLWHCYQQPKPSVLAWVRKWS